MLRLSPPLIPLPDDLLRLPMPVPMPPSPLPVRRSPRKSLTSVVSSPMDLSREGPFDAFCVPSDTGDHPLISEGLAGCPYRMTSIRRRILLRWIRYFGPNSTTNVSSSVSRHPSQLGYWVVLRRSGSGRWISYGGSVTVAAGCLMASNVQVLGQYVTSLNRM